MHLRCRGVPQHALERPVGMPGQRLGGWARLRQGPLLLLLLTVIATLARKGLHIQELQGSRHGGVR